MVYNRHMQKIPQLNMGLWVVSSETWTKKNRQNYHQHCQAFHYFGWQFLLGDFGPKYTTNCCLPWTLSGISLFRLPIFVEWLGDFYTKYTKNMAFHEPCQAFLYYDWQFLFSGKGILTQNIHFQAFRYFGWLTMAPLLVLHCLLCSTAFQMGDNTLYPSWMIWMPYWTRRHNRICLQYTSVMDDSGGAISNGWNCRCVKRLAWHKTT